MGWIGLGKGDFFDPTYHGGLKKFNPTQPTWVGLNQWIGQIFLLLLLLN